MSENENTVNLESSLNISRATELYEDLSHALSLETKEIELNPTQLESIDTACVQTLVVFIKEAKNREMTVKWTKSSDVLCETCKTLGMQEALGITELCSS